MNRAWHEGHAAGQRLVAPSSNFYPERTSKHEDWASGWNQGAAENIAAKNAERLTRRGCFAAEACTELGT